MKREQGLRNGYIHLIVARHDRIYTHIFISSSLGTTVYIRTHQAQRWSGRCRPRGRVRSKLDTSHWGTGQERPRGGF